MARDKLIQRKIYDMLSNRPLMAFFTIILLVLSIFQIYGIYIISTGNIVDAICDKHCCKNIGQVSTLCEPIDAVYTWVNGSDPIWLAEMRNYAGSERVYDTDDFEPSRYDDKQELKYSLRSLEQYAPWIRNIYILTAGQLPWWLNVQSPRLKLLTHEDVIPENYLPTFSSPAIECFIHKIPGLSEKFLYLNDDVFLGGPMYMSDLYTESEGYEVYTAWNVPECAQGCPWSFLGDRSCDSACNIVECDYDGGDCLGDPKNKYYGAVSHLDYLGDYFDSPFFDEEDRQDYDSVGKYPGFDEPPFDSKIVQARQHEDQDLLDSLRVDRKEDFPDNKIVKRETEDQFWAPEPVLFSANEEGDTPHQKTAMRNLKSVKIPQSISKELKNDVNVNKVSHVKSETSQVQDLKDHELQVPKNLYQKSKENLIDKLKKVTYNKLNVSGAVHNYNKSYLKFDKKTRRRKSARESPINVPSKRRDYRKLPMYARSLIHSNKLFNQEYGFQNRKVPAHVPFLMEKRVIEDMHKKFKEHVLITARNKFRRPNDLQFAFSYYHFLLNQKRELTIEEIFDKYDTDKSGTWSDREVRTVLARVRGLPLTADVVHALESAAKGCDRPEYSSHPTPPGERYLDSDMPTLTKALVSGCPALYTPLKASLGTAPPRARARAGVGRHTFAMLESNITKAVSALDEIRRDTKKFICINDNLDPSREEENAIIRMLLQELYEALLPLPSSFELPPGVANRFLRLSELKDWQDGRRSAWIGLSVCASLLTALSLYHINCFRKSMHRIQTIL